MKLAKLKASGVDVYVVPDHVQLIVPMGADGVNLYMSNVITEGTAVLSVEGTFEEVKKKLGARMTVKED